MQKLKSLVAVKIILGCTLFGLFSAVAMPKYLDINKCNKVCICQANQILVETALAVAYADSLANGVDHFPEKLTPEMFEDGKIPSCAVDGEPIQFDPATGIVFCPHHIQSHSRISE